MIGDLSHLSNSVVLTMEQRKHYDWRLISPLQQRRTDDGATKTLWLATYLTSPTASYWRWSNENIMIGDLSHLSNSVVLTMEQRKHYDWRLISPLQQHRTDDGATKTLWLATYLTSPTASYWRWSNENIMIGDLSHLSNSIVLTMEQRKHYDWRLISPLQQHRTDDGATKTLWLATYLTSPTASYWRWSNENIMIGDLSHLSNSVVLTMEQRKHYDWRLISPLQQRRTDDGATKTLWLATYLTSPTASYWRWSNENIMIGDLSHLSNSIVLTMEQRKHYDWRLISPLQQHRTDDGATKTLWLATYLTSPTASYWRWSNENIMIGDLSHLSNSVVLTMEQRKHYDWRLISPLQQRRTDDGATKTFRERVSGRRWSLPSPTGSPSKWSVSGCCLQMATKSRLSSNTNRWSSNNNKYIKCPSLFNVSRGQMFPSIKCSPISYRVCIHSLHLPC